MQSENEAQNRPGPPGVPTWLKMSGAVVAVLIIAVIIVLLVGGGGGGHGPGRHGAIGLVTPGATMPTAGVLG